MTVQECATRVTRTYPENRRSRFLTLDVPATTFRPMAHVTRPLLTRQQVAHQFAVNIRTVDRWVLTGELGAIRVGGVVRFDPDAVDALLQTRRPRSEAS